MFSTDVADKIFETGKKNGLTVERIGFLAEETGRVILGLTRPNEFVGLLAERLGTTTDAAQKIASDINHGIFFPLREVLKSTHQVDVGESAIQKPPAVDLRPFARPGVTSSPGSSSTHIAQGTAKVPPIDLRKQESEVQPPLVDVGGQRPPAPTVLPANFLIKEEVAKVVAEKRIMPPPSALPPVAPDSQTIAPKDVFPPPSSPYPQVPPPGLPQSSPHVFPPSKVPPIDLRKSKEIELDFMPPPSPSPRPVPLVAPKPIEKLPDPPPNPAQLEKPSAPPPAQPVGQNATGGKTEVSPLAGGETSALSTGIMRSTLGNIGSGTIDLRPQTPSKPPAPVAPSSTPKVKPWSGSDPYREPVE